MKQEKVKMYNSECEVCKKATPHLVHAVSRKRGVLLRCNLCGFVKKRWRKLNRLSDITYFHRPTKKKPKNIGGSKRKIIEHEQKG